MSTTKCGEQMNERKTKLNGRLGQDMKYGKT